jgi:uncharacterized membrane protein
MVFPVIDPSGGYALAAILCALAAAGLWADKTRIGRNISGVAVILIVGIALSNLGVVPKSAPIYDAIWLYLLPTAIPLLLLKANLRRVVSETRGLLLPFSFGVFGTTLGAILAVFLLPLGDSAGALAGIFSATYIGGSMNMAAVAQALDVENIIVSASIAADNVIGVIYLAVLAMIPSLHIFQRFYRDPQPQRETIDQQGTEDRGDAGMRLLDVALSIAIAVSICAIAKAFAVSLAIADFDILVITGLSLLIANLFPQTLQRLRGDFEIGVLMMYLFFAVIGMSVDISALMGQASIVAGFCFIVVISHAVSVFALGWLFKCPLMDIVIASNACAAGPASAAALAAGKGRHDLVAPAVLVGVLGYAIANFVGVSLAKVFV